MRSYSWKRRFLSRQYSDHAFVDLVYRSRAIGNPCPLRAHVIAPRWPTLHDRQMASSDPALHANLVTNGGGDALFAPALNSRHIKLGKTLRCHSSSLSFGTNARLCRNGAVGLPQVGWRWSQFGFTSYE